MYKRNLVSRIERLLLIMPPLLVSHYEKKVLGGETLMTALGEFKDLLSAKLRLILRAILTLLLVAVASLYLSSRYFKSGEIMHATVTVIVSGMVLFLLWRWFSRWAFHLNMSAQHLGTTLEGFYETAQALNPSLPPMPLISEDFFPEGIRYLLVSLAYDVLVQENMLKEATSKRVAFDKQRSIIDGLAANRSRFSEVWDATGKLGARPFPDRKDAFNLASEKLARLARPVMF